MKIHCYFFCSRVTYQVEDEAQNRMFQHIKIGGFIERIKTHLTSPSKKILKFYKL